MSTLLQQCANRNLHARGRVSKAEAITCPKEEVLRRLQRETTCSSCCSALRVMIQRPTHQLTLLQSFVSHEDENGYVLKENLATPKALGDACAKFPLHEWLKNCQPLKRDKRCPMHANSRHIFNSADLWEDMWAEMSSAQKIAICSVNAEELHDKLWQHCTDKHHLCKDCRNNVMWAFEKLTRKCATPRARTHVPTPSSGHCRICVVVIAAFTLARTAESRAAPPSSLWRLLHPCCP